MYLRYIKKQNWHKRCFNTPLRSLRFRGFGINFLGAFPMEEKKVTPAESGKSRRQFLQTASQVAASTAVAVTLLNGSKAFAADDAGLYVSGAAGSFNDDPNRDGDINFPHGTFGNTIFDDPGGPGVTGP
jgi:hypothetical protein